MAKLIPVIMMLLGLAGGAAAGYMLRPEPAPPESPADAGDAEAPADTPVDTAVHELEGQFVVPIVKDGAVRALVLVELAVEVAAEAVEQIAASEPRLRDNLLQIMFDHANTGGFDGLFTANNNMELLRKSLLDGARQVLPPATVSKVLITNILRDGA